jgi:hypothetical protein
VVSRIFLLVDGGPGRKARQPFPDADHAQVEGSCPKCGAADFKVGGSGRRPSKDDRAWEADGYCLACRAHVGTIRVETSTLFGVREDEAVLRGRCRVY